MDSTFLKFMQRIFKYVISLLIFGIVFPTNQTGYITEYGLGILTMVGCAPYI